MDLATLRLAGVVPDAPETPASRRKGKGKCKARAERGVPVPSRGHTIFVDSREEREWPLACERDASHGRLMRHRHGLVENYRPADATSDSDLDDPDATASIASIASSSRLPAALPAAEPLDMGYILPKSKKSHKLRKAQSQSEIEDAQARREIELDEQERALAAEAKVRDASPANPPVPPR